MMKQRWGLDRNVLRPTPGDPWGVEQHHWNTGAEENQQLNPGGPDQHLFQNKSVVYTADRRKSELKFIKKEMADFPGSQFPAARWMAFQLRVNRQVGSLRITLLRSKLHQIETVSSNQHINSGKPEVYPIIS